MGPGEPGLRYKSEKTDFKRVTTINGNPLVFIVAHKFWLESQLAGGKPVGSIIGSLSNDNGNGYDDVSKEWILAVSYFIALIPTLLICQMLAIFFRRWILKDLVIVQKRNRKSLSCVHVLGKTWNWAVSSRSRAETARKCTKTRDARAKLLFC